MSEADIDLPSEMCDIPCKMLHMSAVKLGEWSILISFASGQPAQYQMISTKSSD